VAKKPANGAVLFLLAIGLVIAAAPFYYLYQCLRYLGTRYRLEPGYYDLDAAERERLGSWMRQLQQVEAQFDALAPEALNRNVDGSFDKRSRAGRQAEELESAISYLRIQVVDLGHKPLRRFQAALQIRSNAIAAFFALLVVAAVVIPAALKMQVASVDQLIPYEFKAALFSIPVYLILRWAARWPEEIHAPDPSLAWQAPESSVGGHRKHTSNAIPTLINGVLSLAAIVFAAWLAISGTPTGQAMEQFAIGIGQTARSETSRISASQATPSGSNKREAAKQGPMADDSHTFTTSQPETPGSIDWTLDKKLPAGTYIRRRPDTFGTH
jgi:hypothetical protein